jgi:hypothetical protein
MDEVAKLNFKDTISIVEEETNNIELYSFNGTPIKDAACIKYPFLNDAINLLGFEGIKNCNYVVTNIKARLIGNSDSGLENKVFKLLKNKLNLTSGDFIASAKVKESLNIIYKDLNIDKKGKGTDINNYFEVKKGTKKINNKTVTGFTVVRTKIIFNK